MVWIGLHLEWNKKKQNSSDPIVWMALCFQFSFKKSKSYSRGQQLMCFDRESPQLFVIYDFHKQQVSIDFRSCNQHT